MSIVNILILLFVGMIVSFLINRDIEDTIPPVIFTFLLILYGVAILGKSHHSYQGSLLLVVLVWAFYIIKNKRILPKIHDIKNKLITPAFIMFIVVLAVMYVGYSDHFVLVWDDFHYNATFPKDMYYYGTMPYGTNSATFYKAYLPLMQLFFYWGFQGIGNFSESLMFWYKTVLIYACLLPVMKQINSGSLVKKVSIGILCLLTPFAFMFEMIESLSMDTFMAALCGYALIEIIYFRKKDWFDYAKIILSLTCLTLVKQISPIFTAICLGCWFICELVKILPGKGLCLAKDQDKAAIRKSFITNILAMGVGVVSCLAAYLSWNIFCKIRGNTVYLSGKLVDSVSGSGFSFPDYALDTIKNLFKFAGVDSMNLGSNGLSLAGITIIAVIVMVIITKCNPGKRDLGAGFIVIMLGLLGYLCVLSYTYVFVFEQWEAESLSSLDRYEGTYGVILLMVITYGLALYSYKADTGVKTIMKVLKYSPLVLAIVILIELPWSNLFICFMPGEYVKNHQSQYADYVEAQEEVDKIDVHGLQFGRVLYVTNENNTMYSRASVYDLIPLAPVEFLVEAGLSDASDMLVDTCQGEGAYYVYFADRLVDDEVLADKVKGALAEGVQLEKEKMYYYDRDENVVKLYEYAK